MMNNKYSILLTLLGLVVAQVSNAQWTDVINNNINFEFQVQDNYFNGPNDADGSAEPTIRNDFWLSSTGWLGWQCYNWSCSSPCNNYDNYVGVAGTDYPFTEEFQITMQAWEEDNSSPCEYTVNGIDNDDLYWNGNSTLRGGSIQMFVVYPSTDFRPCNWNPWLGDGTGWIFPNAPNYDQIWKETWRYAHGETYDDPLNFGTISNGTTKTDINANRAVSDQFSSAALYYQNSGGQSSADVWYEFNITAPSLVTISTDHSETDFDTYLSLYSVSDFMQVAFDDDGGANNSSVIQMALCAGSYRVRAEGYSSSTGLFKISVGVSSAGAPSIIDVASYGVSCPGYTDGVVSFNATGGVEPYDAQFNGSTASNNIFYDLSEGTYSINVTDACGSTDSESVTVGVDDTDSPTANCQTLVEINVSQGNTTTLDPMDVDNGSTDNCGIDAYTVSPSTFDISDVGSNTVTLTVTDESGNANTCTTTVYALNNTGIEDDNLSNSLKLFPNPSNGRFNLDLNDIQVGDNASLTVLDNLGRILLSQSIGSKVTQFDLGNIQAGVYRVKIINDGATATKSISILN